MGYDTKFELKSWMFRFSDKNERVSLSGYVYNNPKFRDATYITTTRVLVTEVFDTYVRVYTKNSVYDCYYENFDLNCMDDAIFDFSEVAYMPLPDNRMESGRKLYQCLQNAAQEKYQKEKTMLANAVTNSDEHVVMELASDECYFFKALYVRTKEEEIYTRSCGINLGMIQDSVLIRCKLKNGNIDFRFFPYPFHIRFYEWRTNIKDVFIKNTGPDNLEAETPFGTYIIPPQACYRIADDALEGRDGNKIDS